MTATVEVLATAEPTLAELAGDLNREHAAAQSAALDAVQHAIACGEGLIAVKDKMPYGAWASWVEANLDFNTVSANSYIRIARLKNLVLEADVSSVAQARKLLLGLPEVTPKAPPKPPDELLARARQHRSEGMTYKAIAEAMGIAEATARRWVDPDLNERYFRRRKERAARLKAARARTAEQERQQAVKRALVKEGEAFNEAYAVITRLDGLLGQARQEAQTREKRAAINEAHALRDKMMDTLVRALGVA